MIMISEEKINEMIQNSFWWEAEDDEDMNKIVSKIIDEVHLDWYEDMKDFHREVMLDVLPTVPAVPSDKHKALRVALITEEVKETLDAIEANDLVEITDGIVDSIVVLLGTAVMYGIDVRPVWDEVHANNMTKKDGEMRPDGKRLKPASWKPPEIKKILLEQGMVE